MAGKIFWFIGIVLAIALLVLFISQVRSNAKVEGIARSLPVNSNAEVFTEDTVADLPEPVRRYFRHAIAPGTPLAASVRLKMQGSIRLAPRPWMPLQAEEILSVKGFVWQATAGEGMMKIKGADYYTGGEGRMRFALWGLIPVVNASDGNTMRSAIGRWVGEYFWLPSALLPQQGVSWRALDANTIQASLKADGEPISLTFTIDETGRLLKGTLPRWGNQTEDGSYGEIPFGGEYQTEKTFGGYTIPAQMGAGWHIGTDKYFEFIRTTVEEAQFR